MKLKQLFYWGPKTQLHPKGNRLYELISELDFILLKFFIKRYANRQLDQWEKWKLNTEGAGEVFVYIGQGEPGLGDDWHKVD